MIPEDMIMSYVTIADRLELVEGTNVQCTVLWGIIGGVQRVKGLETFWVSRCDFGMIFRMG
jgi:hypothetical protein